MSYGQISNEYFRAEMIFDRCAGVHALDDRPGKNRPLTSIIWIMDEIMGYKTSPTKKP
jgi:hypothetical protein